MPIQVSGLAQEKFIYKEIIGLAQVKIFEASVPSLSYFKLSIVFCFNKTVSIGEKDKQRRNDGYNYTR